MQLYLMPWSCIFRNGQYSKFYITYALTHTQTHTHAQGWDSAVAVLVSTITAEF